MNILIYSNNNDKYVVMVVSILVSSLVYMGTARKVVVERGTYLVATFSPSKPRSNLFYIQKSTTWSLLINFILI